MVKKSCLFIVLIIGFLFFSKDSLALTVGPAKVEINASPGEKIKLQFFVRNDSDFEDNFIFDLEGFTEDGEVKNFYKNPPEKDWFQLPKSIKLKPKELKYVDVEINIPQSAPPGGHFLVLWVQNKPLQEKEVQVGIVTRVGSLIYLNVAGNIIEKASFSKIDYQVFNFRFPIKFAVTVKNEGNTYIRPEGNWIIKDIFGRTKAILSINPRILQILPHKEKILENKWEGPFAFGPYHVLLSMNYGKDNAQSLNYNFWIFVFPLKFTIILLFVIIFLVLVLPRLIRAYNQWIIKKALKSDS